MQRVPFIVHVCDCNVGFLDKLLPSPAHTCNTLHSCFYNPKHKDDVKEEATLDVRGCPKASCAIPFARCLTYLMQVELQL